MRRNTAVRAFFYSYRLSVQMESSEGVTLGQLVGEATHSTAQWMCHINLAVRVCSCLHECTTRQGGDGDIWGRGLDESLRPYTERSDGEHHSVCSGGSITCLLKGFPPCSCQPLMPFTIPAFTHEPHSGDQKRHSLVHVPLSIRVYESTQCTSEGLAELVRLSVRLISAEIDGMAWLS